jgi:hypothetical protein
VRRTTWSLGGEAPTEKRFADFRQTAKQAAQASSTRGARKAELRLGSDFSIQVA